MTMTIPTLPNPSREEGLVLDSIFIANKSELPAFDRYFPEVTVNLALTEDTLSIIASVEICVRTHPGDGAVIAKLSSHCVYRFSDKLDPSITSTSEAADRYGLVLYQRSAQVLEQLFRLMQSPLVLPMSISASKVSEPQRIQ